MSPQTMPPFSCLGEKKVLTDKFAIGDLTAEEVSRLGIIDSIIAGEEKQKKSAKMDLMEFTAAADNGLLWHQNNGGAMVQIAMDRLCYRSEPDDSTVEIE
jgi:hypothetical protein